MALFLIMLTCEKVRVSKLKKMTMEDQTDASHHSGILLGTKGGNISWYVWPQSAWLPGCQSSLGQVV